MKLFKSTVFGEYGGLYHARNEFDLRWFIRIIFIKLHDEFECAVFERSICRTDDDGIPIDID
jgi:hypothetical protein